MRARDEFLQLSCMEWRSVSICRGPNVGKEKHYISANGDKKYHFKMPHDDLSTNKKPAASLKRRKWGLGIPIHIQTTCMLINMSLYAIYFNRY